MTASNPPSGGSSFAKKFSNTQSGGSSFTKKHTSSESGRNNLSEIIKQKQEKKPMTTSQALSNNSNTQNSSIAPEKAAKSDLIYLVKGVDDNRNAWYYVLVERLKVQMFLKALNDDIIHLENYGDILFSAYGDEPPQEVTDQLKAEYGIS